MEKYSTPQQTETHFTTVSARTWKAWVLESLKDAQGYWDNLNHKKVSEISNSSITWYKKLKHSEQKQARKNLTFKKNPRQYHNELGHQSLRP